MQTEQPNGAHKRPISIAILGAGMSGICMAIQLKKAGFDEFTIFEKYGNVGGTWRDNIYPGVACDVPSHLYSYSFEPNPGWSHIFSPGREIQEYFERCAKKYGLTPHIQLNTEITEAKFDNQEGLWHLKTADGDEISAQVIVSGVGALHNPQYPEIPGLDSFVGDQFHSSRWPQDMDLSGRNVAIIGSAASAVQIVPQIATLVKRLYLFQRTANWIIPRHDRPYPEAFKRWFRRLPILARLHRWMIYWRMESRFGAFVQGARLNTKFRQFCLDHLAEQVPDPALRQALTPDYPPGCKRILLSDNFFPALCRGNVELVTSPIERIVPEGVVTGDGNTASVDTLILATGFRATELLAPLRLAGLDGLTLCETWKDGISSHRTITLPGFPNFFMLLGPNSGLGHNSIIFMVEQQVRYVIQCLERLRDGEIRYLDANKEAAARFNQKVQHDMEKTIWKAGCKSWYQDDRGRVVALWPHSTLKYRRDMKRVNFDEYEQIK